MHWMVFASTDQGTRLQWGNPLGVYETDDHAAACKAAATEHHYIGTFAAVECHMWGVDMLASELRSVGSKDTPEDKVNNLLDELRSQVKGLPPAS